MGSEIGADVPLDYVTFQILPDNRYGASICSEDKAEMVKDGPLELLLEHLPSIKDQIIEGSCDDFKLELPSSITTREWFTKATLMRFLHVIGSADALKKSIAISNEMSQLEETRKFHLSLYTQADKIATSDNSKNELLRAMDSRIAALTEELLPTFDLAAGAVFSFQEMIGLREFCQHFGDVDIRNLLMKLSEKSPKSQTTAPVNNKQSPIPLVSKSDYVNKVGGNVKMSSDLNSLKPVQYDASPAKAAELERQSSSGSDESSYSSEDERPSAAERSRTLIRSASPRRSASPMRKVQIGRSGSRRTPALTIRSLPYFPARERIPSYRDSGSDCKPEDSEEPNRKPEINVTRMSVQDAISLFESRQKDQSVESQKKTGVENSNTNKAVLRRWSSGMSVSQKSMMSDTVEPTASENNAEDKDEHAHKSAEIEQDGFPDFENQKFEETAKTGTELEGSKDIAMNLSEDGGTVNQTEEEGCEKLDSAEWTRQKEEELNKMLMKFAQYNLSNIKNTDPDNKQTKKVSRMGQSGINNGQRREKKDAAEKSVKRVEKQSGIGAKQRVPDKPKPEKSYPKVNDTGKKLPASRTSTVNRTAPISSSGKKETLKPAVPKKLRSKTSPLPSTRKSWPSTPSPRVTGAFPTRSSTVTPPSITSAPRQKSQSPAPRQKPQSPGSVSRPSPKLEKPQVQQKDMKKPLESKKSVKKVNESKSRVVPKNGKTAKIKTVAAPEEDAPVAVSPAKGVVRKKVTKKSSVVPLEVKQSIRKVSEKSPAKSPASQKREIVPPQVEETLSKSENTQIVVENYGISSDKMVLVEAQDSETQDGQHVELEIESEIEKPENGMENEVCVEMPQGNEVGERIIDSPAKIQIQPAQESVISPAAWVEDDHEDTTILPPGDNASSLANPDEVASSGMRVRHSLSQMLLEESSEPDVIEWGNAEHPPSMVYQKDAPKGLKRLLKFARKNKEANGAAWASPYTSEGEDDGDEYRNLAKGKSDNLLKVALHSKNYAEGFLSDNEPLSARSNASNASARSSKFQDGHGSSKGARSFFSLSAFRGKN